MTTFSGSKNGKHPAEEFSTNSLCSLRLRYSSVGARWGWTIEAQVSEVRFRRSPGLASRKQPEEIVQLIVYSEENLSTEPAGEAPLLEGGQGQGVEPP